MTAQATTPGAGALASRVAGSDLHYVRIGEPRAGTIVFLHGITESRRYFQKPVAPLADRYELLIPDLPGFGLSPKPVARYEMALFLDAVHGFIDARAAGREPLYIVGHSLGTLIALEYAALCPERVKAMVLLNLPRHFSQSEAHGVFWNGSPSYRRLLQQHSLRASLGQLRRTGLSMSLRYARRFPWAVLADARKFTFLSLTSTLENCLLNYRVDATLARAAKIPTLLIHGELDQVAPLAHVRTLPAEHPWMKLAVIRRSGHHVLHTHTPQIVRTIRGFLSDEA